MYYTCFQAALFLLFCISVCRCNIWDNIISANYAPYINIPSNFLIVLTDNSSYIKPELGISVSGDNNTVMIELNTTVGENPDPIYVSKAIYNISKVTLLLISPFSVIERT